MFKAVSLVLLALAAVSAVNAAPIVARKAPPPGWIAEILEPYNAYHTRYLAIGCREKHNTQFFDDCCHPMKKGETLTKNRKAYCRPGAGPTSSQPPANTLLIRPTSTSSPAPEPTSGGDDDCEDGDDDDDDDDNDDEDCDEDPVSSPPVPSYTHTPVPTSTKTPVPTSTKTPVPTSTKTPVQTSTPTPDPPKPSPTPEYGSPETHTGGLVTWYEQHGNYGACGNKHSDDDLIAALDSRTYGNTGGKSKYCGQKIRVSWQGKSVDVTVEDACPTCENPSSVDLSVAAFKALAPTSVGVLKDVTWELL